MKIYTGTGDEGFTSLLSGKRVLKSNKRIDAYGDVDELSAFLGVVSSLVCSKSSDIVKDIVEIQSELLKAGAWLASDSGSSSIKKLDLITEEPAKNLESRIDKMSEKLPPLKGFIMSGGDPASAHAHVARTVCRRAERHVISLVEEQKEALYCTQVNLIIVYLNRLSDYLFVLSRYCSYLSGFPDNIWVKQSVN